MSTELRPSTPAEPLPPEADATLPGAIPAHRAPARRPVSGVPSTRPRPGLPARAFDGGSGMPALRQVGTPRVARKVGVMLMFAFVALPALMMLVPWRQSVYGDGQVIGFHPLDREFMVDAPIYGRVMRYYVNEGDVVKAGDPIASVENIDPLYVETLDLQLGNYEMALDQAEQTVRAYEAALVQKRLEKVQAIAEAEASVAEAERKVTEAEGKVTEAEADAAGYEILFDQSTKLYERGLGSGADRVKAEQIYRTAEQKLRQAEAALAQAQKSVEAYQAKRDAVEAKAEAEIEKAKSDVAIAQGYVQKAENEIQDARVKIRQQQQGGQVLAPRAGTVLRLLTNVGAGAYVKDGDPLAILIPETPHLAAEIYLPGRDVPLVRAGDQARLQFEGWPALQFIGWPSAAVGTFPGKVALVDSTQTKPGKFRILVVPDMDGPELNYGGLRRGRFSAGDVVTGRLSGASATVVAVEPDGDDPGVGELTIGGISGEFRPDEPMESTGGAFAYVRSPWPSDEFLRQGARANGWVLLREVPLGFEIWRRLNGFAPVVAKDEPSAKAGASGEKDDKPKVKRPK
ncbi:HlyD family secretion protein [Tautonia plasticadhaerens]|uniref:Pyruvate carboxylase subunit B n=1 Tax=Tautonia plasticadhaerens TaxID=2527974 RepID=A0A518H6N2_9BACT|nr:HlyD family efflux transporter periplasmic adaptor subunit [Tautonia plasticadhaerens]QDV36478.1 pyruvate carboxylase subunit B [Tautonia plasticadhaerens]